MSPYTNDLHRRSHEDVSDDQDDEDVDGFIAANESRPIVNEKVVQTHARTRLFASFVLFGLLNNVLYVIILSAALDLVDSTTPKGLVAFFNILPALLTKVGWPIISNGQIRYTRRVGFCTVTSWLGIITIAFSSTLYPRLLGISLASLSSGLGELTFLQLTTTLPTRSSSKVALGAWSSGTGFAGIAGAGIWWLFRGLGVKGGLGLSSILPLFFPIIYKFLLPSFSSLAEDSQGARYQPLSSNTDTDYEADLSRTSIPPIFVTRTSSDPLPRLLLIASETSKSRSSTSGRDDVRLAMQEKMDLVRPLLTRYMLPLCAVYIEEYVINSGVAPTLVFPLPTSGIWSMLFKSPRDYYPFWSLSYQTFVFLSRSSLSLGFPPLPKRLLPLPPLIQFLVLTLLSLQAKSFIFSSPSYTPPNPPPTQGVDRTISIVFLLICLEGLCGGSSYVNTFYHVGREGDDVDGGGRGENDYGEDDEQDQSEVNKKKLEREFRIGAVGAADSCGILLASLISMPLEISLCNSQVEKGRTLCRDL